MQSESPQYWHWLKGGLALGVVFLLAVILVKPIGVSTQYVILDGLAWQTVSPGLVTTDDSAKHGYSSNNAYLNKSGGKYAHAVADPLNYSFIFVLAMALGGFLSHRVSTKNHAKGTPSPTSADHKLWFSFLGGFLVLFGARFAGGCTSGHMMSGMMQTSLSGYLFAAAVFATAIPLAIILRKGANK